jgi:hypothetical protein
VKCSTDKFIFARLCQWVCGILNQIVLAFRGSLLEPEAAESGIPEKSGKMYRSFNLHRVVRSFIVSRGSQIPSVQGNSKPCTSFVARNGICSDDILLLQQSIVFKHLLVWATAARGKYKSAKERSEGSCSGTFLQWRQGEQEQT